MPSSSPTVLLVEDEALVSLVAEDHLRAFGFEPFCAASGREAMAFIDGAASAPRFAMIDVGLPDMRGDDLAQTLRARLPHTKIILASGYDPQTLKQRFADDDHVTVIGKPYGEEDLRRAICSLGFTV